MSGKRIKKLSKKGRLDPLASQLDEEQFFREKQLKKVTLDNSDSEDDTQAQQLNEKGMKIARKQLMDEQRETSDKNKPTKIKIDVQDDDSDDEDYAADFEHAMEAANQITEEDEMAMQAFMNPNEQKVDLGDLIRQKLEEFEYAQNMPLEQQIASRMNPKAVKVYKSVGTLMSRYKSGPVPKAFKIIPSLSNWEEVLYLTTPERWTPHAWRVAMRTFVSGLSEKQCQKFFLYTVFPMLRERFFAHRRLNLHIFIALKKATFKPGAFFRGIILPLCESGNCSLREAAVYGAVISRTSIPVLHSAAALLKISEMTFSPTRALFLHFLLNKRYALPYRVIDGLVLHFDNTSHDDSTRMPKMWHQSMLTFVQRYKNDLTDEEKRTMLQVCRRQTHGYFTPEVRRELAESRSRETKQQSVDDHMIMDID